MSPSLNVLTYNNDNIYSHGCFKLTKCAATVHWCSQEELPHVQGKRNPSKMIGAERGIRGQTD